MHETYGAMTGVRLSVNEVVHRGLQGHTIPKRRGKGWSKIPGRRSREHGTIGNSRALFGIDSASYFECKHCSKAKASSAKSNMAED